MRLFVFFLFFGGRIKVKNPQRSIIMNNTNNVTSSDNVTVELLSEMYRNVTMGSENLSTVVPMIRDSELMSDVTRQLESYADFTNRTADLLKHHNTEAKEPTFMKKAMSRGGIKLNTMIDSSDEHIAQMIAKGTETGADELRLKYEQLRDRGCDKNALNLCDEILDFERKEIARANQMREGRGNRAE